MKGHESLSRLADGAGDGDGSPVPTPTPLTEKTPDHLWFPLNLANYGQAIRPDDALCPRFLMMCCGSCTNICQKRCLLDTQSRLHLHYQQLKAHAELHPTATAAAQPTMLAMLSRPEGIPYQQATHLVDQITSMHHMSKEKRRRVLSYDPTNRENPAKFDYAPRVEFTQPSHESATATTSQTSQAMPRPQVDPTAGIVRVIPWPTSGLCKYCLPRTSTYGKTGRPSKRVLDYRNRPEDNVPSGDR